MPKRCSERDGIVVLFVVIHLPFLDGMYLSSPQLPIPSCCSPARCLSSPGTCMLVHSHEVCCSLRLVEATSKADLPPFSLLPLLLLLLARRQGHSFRRSAARMSLKRDGRMTLCDRMVMLAVQVLRTTDVVLTEGNIAKSVGDSAWLFTMAWV